jgi:hypothetical protein
MKKYSKGREYPSLYSWYGWWDVFAIVFAIIATILIFLSTTGCVSQQTFLKHPVTNDVQYCKNWGVGWLGVPLALIMQKDCVDKYKNLGYEEEK